MTQSRRIYLYPGAGPGGRHKFTLGTFNDLKSAGIVPKSGMRLQFYADDADASGNRDDLLFDGVIDFDQRLGWYAIIEGEIRSESEIGIPGTCAGQEQTSDGSGDS